MIFMCTARSVEAVRLRREADGDEGEDIQWETVYGNERVLPFADIHQCGRNIPVDLRNIVEGEAGQRVSVLGHTSESA